MLLFLLLVWEVFLLFLLGLVLMTGVNTYIRFLNKLPTFGEYFDIGKFKVINGHNYFSKDVVIESDKPVILLSDKGINFNTIKCNNTLFIVCRLGINTKNIEVTGGLVLYSQGGIYDKGMYNIQKIQSDFLVLVGHKILDRMLLGGKFIIHDQDTGDHFKNIIRSTIPDIIRAGYKHESLYYL